MPELLVIMFKGCGEPCADIMRQLNEPSMRKFLKESHGIDKIRELDGESDDLAAKILISTEQYEMPLIATVKDKKVCVFKLDPLVIERCVELKDVPK